MPDKEKEKRALGNETQKQIIEALHSLCDKHGIWEMDVKIREGEVKTVATYLMQKTEA